MKIQTESRKGQECPFKPILCEEGFCGECQVYLDYLGYLKTTGRLGSIVPTWLQEFERERGCNNTERG